MMKKLIENSLHFLSNQLHILIMLVGSILNMPATAQDSITANYLRQNMEKIAIGGSNSFSLFDEAFYQNQVFLLSESHGYDKPHELDFEIFKQLNKKTEVRYYLAEMDASQAHYLNQYLVTGNEAFLKSIYEYWYNQQAQWGCKAGFEKWKKMYAYNKTLPAGEKMMVLGLDEAQDLNMNVKLLNELMATSGYKNGKDLLLDSMALYTNMNLEKNRTKNSSHFIPVF